MDKLEKHVKEKLEERRIAPSSKAWDSISSQIPETKKSPGKKWLPYAIAASFIGTLMVSILFLTGNEVEENAVEVVNQDSTKIEKSIPETNDFNLPVRQAKETQVVAVDTEKTFIEESKSTITLEEVPKVVTESQEQTFQDDFKRESNEIIDQKVKEVIAQVAFLENGNTEVSEAEVDSLLRAAQMQILTEELFEDDNIDPMVLLAQAEDELDESFREQIFDALKDGYSKLRTAVADRNN